MGEKHEPSTATKNPEGSCDSDQFQVEKWRWTGTAQQSASIDWNYPSESVALSFDSNDQSR